MPQLLLGALGYLRLWQKSEAARWGVVMKSLLPMLPFYYATMTPVLFLHLRRHFVWGVGGKWNW